MPFRCVLLVAWAYSVQAAAANAPKSAASEQDKSFLRFAAEAAMTQAHEARIGAARASTRDVRDFGQKLAQDWEYAYGRVLQLAQRAGETVPRGMALRQDQDTRELENLHGASFDARFVSDEIREQQSEIPAFEREANHGQDQQIRTWAQEWLAILDDHLMQARQLALGEKWNS